MNKLIIETVSDRLRELGEDHESLVSAIETYEKKLVELKSKLEDTETNIDEIKEFLNASKVNSKAAKQTEDPKSGQERVRAPQGDNSGAGEGNSPAQTVVKNVRKARAKS